MAWAIAIVLGLTCAVTSNLLGPWLNKTLMSRMPRRLRITIALLTVASAIFLLFLLAFMSLIIGQLFLMMIVAWFMSWALINRIKERSES